MCVCVCVCVCVCRSYTHARTRIMASCFLSTNPPRPTAPPPAPPTPLLPRPLPTHTRTPVLLRGLSAKADWAGDAVRRGPTDKKLFQRGEVLLRVCGSDWLNARVFLRVSVCALSRHGRGQRGSGLGPCVFVCVCLCVSVCTPKSARHGRGERGSGQGS
jgi:hypothetical protein